MASDSVTISLMSAILRGDLVEVVVGVFHDVVVVDRLEDVDLPVDLVGDLADRLQFPHHAVWSGVHHEVLPMEDGITIVALTFFPKVQSEA